jgi:hypothetical protein
MAKKGPQYLNCNERQTSCTRRQAQPRKGCPTCEFTIQFKIFTTELEKELKKLPKGTRKGARRWPISMLLETVSEIATLSHRYKDKPFPNNWAVPVTMLIGVYRDEAGKKSAIDSFNALPAESQKTTLVNDPKDEGDFD